METIKWKKRIEKIIEMEENKQKFKKNSPRFAHLVEVFFFAKNEIKTLQKHWLFRIYFEHIQSVALG